MVQAFRGWVLLKALNELEVLYFRSLERYCTKEELEEEGSSHMSADRFVH